MGTHKRVAEWELITPEGLINLPPTYQDAVIAGSDYYFKKPCKRGHLVPHRTKLRDCPKCSQMRHRGELIAIVRLVEVFHMLVDLSKRQVGFRGLQDSILIEDKGEDYDTQSEFDNEITSSCPFDSKRRVCRVFSGTL